MKPWKGSPILTLTIDSYFALWVLLIPNDGGFAATQTCQHGSCTRDPNIQVALLQGTLADAAASFDGTACSCRYVLEQWGSQRQCVVFTAIL